MPHQRAAPVGALALRREHVRVRAERLDGARAGRALEARRHCGRAASAAPPRSLLVVAAAVVAVALLHTAHVQEGLAVLVLVAAQRVAEVARAPPARPLAAAALWGARQVHGRGSEDLCAVAVSSSVVAHLKRSKARAAGSASSNAGGAGRALARGASRSCALVRAATASAR